MKEDVSKVEVFGARAHDLASVDGGRDTRWTAKLRCRMMMMMIGFRVADHESAVEINDGRMELQEWKRKMGWRMGKKGAGGRGESVFATIS